MKNSKIKVSEEAVEQLRNLSDRILSLLSKESTIEVVWSLEQMQSNKEITRASKIIRRSIEN